MARARKSTSKHRHLEQAEVTIDGLGRQGDGVARHGDRVLHVPFSAPGDRLLVEIDQGAGAGPATPLKLVSAGPERIVPPCPHFGSCGGCRMQHLATDRYLAWKRGIVCEALAKVGLDAAAVARIMALPADTRRRVVLAARRTRQGVVLGFNERRSARIVDLDRCPIARPEIVALLPALREMLPGILTAAHSVDLAITLLDDGSDLLLVGGEEPDLAQRQLLAGFAERHDLARLSWRGSANRLPEPVAHRRPGTLRLGEVAVVLPPGGFCQASREGEAALADLVLGAVDTDGPVADLFCGVGTFGLRLAAGRRRVVGFDGDAPSVAAFDAAARNAGFVHKPEVRVRDLFRDPLPPAELNGFKAIVFDPPRAGAKAQTAALAASTVPIVVGVSCNPATFARDARLLVDGGYRLERVTPVDQFVWSHHVELVGVFSR